MTAKSIEAPFRMLLASLAPQAKEADEMEGVASRVGSLLGRYGLIREAFPIGSLVNGTALPQTQLDVAVALSESICKERPQPMELLERLCQRIGCLVPCRIEQAGGSSITIELESGCEVHVFPLIPVPDGTQLLPDGVRNVWIPTDPRKHGGAIRALPERARQLIRLFKLWDHRADLGLRSFHIECLLAHHPEISGDWSWDVYRAFSRAIQGVERPLSEPGEGCRQVDGYLSEGCRRRALRMLVEARDAALQAWELAAPPSGNCAAATEIYRQLFGEGFPALLWLLDERERAAEP
jgi:hypothetical protein